MNGKGVQRDINIARTWFERAATLGNVEAQENLQRLEQAVLIDPAQVAARRTSCMQTCAALHSSYINSVCEHYSPTTNGEKPEPRSKLYGRQHRPRGRMLAASASSKDAQLILPS